MKMRDVVLNQIKHRKTPEVPYTLPLEEEVAQRLEQMAQRLGMTADQLRAQLEKRNGIEGLKGEIRAEKTLDFLLEHAKVKK